MTDPTPVPPYCVAGRRPAAAPCEGPGDAVLVRGPFMSRAREAMTEPVAACVLHGAELFADLHGDLARESVHLGRITTGPGGDDQSVLDTIERVLAAPASSPAPAMVVTPLTECGTPAGPSVPITAEETAEHRAAADAFPTVTLVRRCAAAAIPAPGDDSECDGRHNAVVVRPRFSARLRHNVLDTVTGCVHHGARLLVVGNGGSVAPGPGGTEADAAAVRTRAEAAWGILASPAPASDHDLSDAFDPAAADTVHYVDPRVRRLAQAAWRRKTGGTYRQWLMLGKNHPDALIAEAREWMRAAVAAGLLPPPTTD